MPTLLSARSSASPGDDNHRTRLRPSDMKIYLAGPEVFEPDAVGRGAALKALCARFSSATAPVVGLFPLDNEISDDEAAAGANLATAIRTANMAMIRACDAIVANMTPFRGPSMDVGTAYEMGVGAALGKVVVGYTSDARSYARKVRDLYGDTVVRGPDGRLRDERGMAVEDFPGEAGLGLVDNLMMTAGGIEGLCGSAEEAIALAVEKTRSRRMEPSQGRDSGPVESTAHGS
ncbi:MAG: hypothetical protein M1818_007623 [Claussenomyces sp. TS43310]|nr:MAG: hypothetical protein M1818_007623 [Claussenomyces sp. TS43310]